MRNILIVVDMQNDFIEGALGSAAARAVVPAVAAKTAKAKERGDTVVFTLDTHADDYLSMHEGRLLPVKHCISGTWGHELQKDIMPFAGEGAIIVKKPSFGSFELIDALKPIADGETSFELCGLCTDICVISNALLLRTAFPENDIFVDADACAGTTPAAHEAALAAMRSCHIAVLSK